MRKKLERWQRNTGNKWARKPAKKPKHIGDIYYPKDVSDIIYMKSPINADGQSKKPLDD
jgi:hypothetical protein